MRGTRITTWCTVIVGLLLFGGGHCAAQPQPAGVESYYFGIEINGVLCGYAEIQLSKSRYEGREVIKLDESVFAMGKALGSTFNTRQRLSYVIDPKSGNFLFHENDQKQGETHRGAVYIVRDDAVLMTQLGETKETRIEPPPNSILPNAMIFRFLTDAFADPQRKTLDCKQLEVYDAKILDFTYMRRDDEELDLAGKKWNALVVDEFNHATGTKIRMWIDHESGHLLRVEYPNRKFYRTYASVVNSLKVADLDASILRKTNKSIAEAQGISYLKVHARLKPRGLRITQESLNVPGQSFTGTVNENQIDGAFEVSHPRYDGSQSPPFTPDFRGDPAMKKYLEPSTLCESDNPALAAKAREITMGMTNSWEAATKLSAWVAENIAYALPGKFSARKTFEVRAGECGDHSLLLAAMCRSVGIPARVVWGCTYSPILEGSFGQHAWNEIYMGAARWIPVDATAHEIDFVDSGHLRIGEMESLSIAINAEDLEIIDYRIGNPGRNLKAKDNKDPEDAKATRPREIYTNGINQAHSLPNRLYTFPDGDERTHRYLEALLNRFMKDLDPARFIKSDRELTEEDIQTRTIYIYGSPENHRLFQRVRNQLPILFESDGIVVGNKKCLGRDVGAILVCPNPLNPTNRLVIYGTVSPESVDNMNSVFHGSTDYIVFNQTTRLSMEGNPADRFLLMGAFDKSDPAHWRVDEKLQVRPPGALRLSTQRFVITR